MKSNLAIAEAPVSPTGGLQLGRLGDSIGFRLRRVQNQLSRDFAAATSGNGLRSGLFSSLALIDANPGLSQSELAREVGLDKSVVVTIVDDLETFGWALRGRSEVDRRRHSLTVTDAGKAQLQKLFATLAETEQAALGELSRAELLLMNELLDRMYAACMRDAE
jgi:DNA-binding MarR family transcriptional regulator